jgi:hypothetical protein
MRLPTRSSGVARFQFACQPGAVETKVCRSSRGVRSSAMAHARKTVAVAVGPGTIQVAVEPGITFTAARTTSRDIRRHKAPDYG